MAEKKKASTTETKTSAKSEKAASVAVKKTSVKTKVTKVTKASKEKPEKIAVKARADRGKLSKRLKEGVEVRIMKGSERGKTGEVIRYDRKTGKVYVSELNMALDYGKTSLNRIGDKKMINKPFNISNIKIVE